MSWAQSTVMALGCVLFAACHPQTEVRGIYVNQDTTGTLFPCTEANAMPGRGTSGDFSSAGVELFDG